MTDCKYDRGSKRHLTRAHLADCTSTSCQGCEPCVHDDTGHPVRHCRTRTRCTSHLGWTEWVCPTCVGKIRGNLTRIVDLMALMPEEAEERGLNSEPANLAGPHADYVTAQWRLVNADREGQTVEELDLRDPYTCLTFHERNIREELGHDEETLVSATLSASAGYLAWVLTDLARGEEFAPLASALLGDTARLRSHMEAALLDSSTPERGIPCPECVRSRRDAPRLERVYAHYCERDDCEREHVTDETADVWRCPDNWRHEWTHKAYEERLVERRARRVS